MLTQLRELLFPAQCAACGALGSGLCAACFPYEVPLAFALPTLRVRALGVYAGALRAAILAVKDGRRDVARALGERARSVLAPDVCVSAVPTSRRRIQQRGMDGVRRIAAHASASVLTPGLQLIAEDTQRGRSRTARLAATGRFLCRADLMGMRLTLLDDVCTTGATLEDCARALRAAGGSVAEAVVIARADPLQEWDCRAGREAREACSVG